MSVIRYIKTEDFTAPDTNINSQMKSAHRFEHLQMEHVINSIQAHAPKSENDPQNTNLIAVTILMWRKAFEFHIIRKLKDYKAQNSN